MAPSLRLLVFVILVVTGAWLAPGAGAQMTDTVETSPTQTAESPDGDGQVTTQERDDDLPNTGASVWFYAIAGAGALNIGGWMLVAERRLRPTSYWEHHGG